MKEDLQMVLTQGHPGPACLFTTATTKVWRGDDMSCMLPPPPSPPCARVHHFIVPLRMAILALLRARLCARRTWLWTRARVARVPRLALHPRSAVWTHGSAALPVPSRACGLTVHTRTRARVTAGHAVAQAGGCARPAQLQPCWPGSDAVSWRQHSHACALVLCALVLMSACVRVCACLCRCALFSTARRRRTSTPRRSSRTPRPALSIRSPRTPITAPTTPHPTMTGAAPATSGTTSTTATKRFTAHCSLCHCGHHC